MFLNDILLSDLIQMTLHSFSVFEIDRSEGFGRGARVSEDFKPLDCCTSSLIHKGPFFLNLFFLLIVWVIFLFTFNFFLIT